jgi:hypothetical protein
METDDGVRSSIGVVATLVDAGDGTSRLILDDVASAGKVGVADWKHVRLFTRIQFGSCEADEMRLPADTYKAIGESVMARLLALNARIK